MTSVPERIELVEIVAPGELPGLGDPDDQVHLPFDRRQKSRQRLRLESGTEAALFLPADASLGHGDRLRSSDGRTVRVVAADEDVAAARTADPRLFARACYHLGNRHVPLQIGDGWVRFQADHVLEAMLVRLGLEVLHESAPFEPERGAYHSRAHAHGPSHAHRGTG